ncbi:hypothetical protein M8C21_025108 [Ambrosia artemisiifolia]|uniref:Alpha/beta hydrolase fold-3 domain-containing protein n=1 Tax=Ambrosia artemisiifolia TaxID=4212 RepID=A0AAD5BVE6_AMBAR|nr:hypothetical protein M8C21_025108 [Ambrosia artemisiifolia]
MGSSAGGNLAYHVGLRVSEQVSALKPLEIKGLILHNPYFGGVERMDSEIRLASAQTDFTLSLSDAMWDLAFPVGANRNHEYCNPMIGGGLEGMGRVKAVGWKVLVAIRYGDLMIDRQMEFAKGFESKGVECKCCYGDGDHCTEYFDKSKAKELCAEISSFFSLVNVVNG